MIQSQLIARRRLFGAAAIGAMAISLSVHSVLASSNAASNGPKISCEVAMSRMLHRNGYGLNLQSLTPGTVVNSFKVSDIEHSMGLAYKAVHSLPTEFELPAELEKKLSALLSKIEPLEKRDAALNAEIEALTHEYEALLEVENGSGLRQTVQYLSDKLTAKKLEAAKLRQDQLNPLYVEYDQFTSLNRIYPKGVGQGVVKYVQYSDKSRELAKAIEQGDVADANRRVREVRSTMLDGQLSFPFDEIVVLRAEPLSVHHARNDKAAVNFHKAQELQRLEARIDTLRNLLEKPRPAAVTSELKRSLETAESAAKTLKKEVAEGATSFMRPSPPITILKSNGSVVAALLDSRSHDGVMAIDQAHGFWCRDLKNVEGAWYPGRGFYSAEYCEKMLRQVDGDKCRRLLELDFPGKVMPEPTPVPGLRAIDPKVNIAPKPARTPDRPTVR